MSMKVYSEKLIGNEFILPCNRTKDLGHIQGKSAHITTSRLYLELNKILSNYLEILGITWKQLEFGLGNLEFGLVT